MSRNSQGASGKPDRAGRASPRAPTGLGHSATIPSAASLLALADDFQSMQPGPDLDNALHDLLPEPKVIQPPCYGRSVDAAVGALRSVFPLADWRKFSPIACTVYGASPYNGKAQIPFDGLGPTEGAMICAAFLKLWANHAQAIEARSGETRQRLDPKDESAVPAGDAP